MSHSSDNSQVLKDFSVVIDQARRHYYPLRLHIAQLTFICFFWILTNNLSHMGVNVLGIHPMVTYFVASWGVFQGVMNILIGLCIYISLNRIFNRRYERVLKHLDAGSEMSWEMNEQVLSAIVNHCAGNGTPNHMRPTFPKSLTQSLQLSAVFSEITLLGNDQGFAAEDIRHGLSRHFASWLVGIIPKITILVGLVITCFYLFNSVPGSVLNITYFAAALLPTVSILVLIDYFHVYSDYSATLAALATVMKKRLREN